MKVRAQAKYVRQSPSKVRLVLDLVRGMPVEDARSTLDFTNRRAAPTIKKVLESAVANAEHNFALDADELFVAEAYADEGPTLKRWRPRARGRATRINKRTSHITIVVADEDDLVELEA
jgi:large subunit ribosomal protein L22